MSAETNLTEKVEFLLRRDQEVQRDMNVLSLRLSAIEREGSRRLEELRETMEAHVERELTAPQADYRAARILGALALAIGLTLTTAAHFIG